jgi:hypothetical protein
MPATESFSNAAEVGAWIRDCVADFGFDSKCGGTTLGEAIVENHVTSIRERSMTEQRGAVEVWPENKEPYKTDKLVEFGSDKINVRTDTMLSEESLRGRPTIGKREIVHLYGTNQPGDPNKNRQGHKPPKSGRSRKRRGGDVAPPDPTDVEKATWAEESGRTFFDLHEAIKDRNAALVADALAEHLRSR